MLDNIKNVFFVGIKGVAMANLALILKKMGKRVCGSDVNESFITDDLLIQNQIKYSYGFAPGDLPSNTDLVIYAASHGGTDNSQVIEAKKRRIPVISQAELINEIMSPFRHKIAVCGTHGKTTTASLLSYVLIKLDRNPSYLIGAPRFNDYWGGDFQKGDYFVVEADEYAVSPPSDLTPKFNFLKPEEIIATTVDFDHPDVYQNLEAVKNAFAGFLEGRRIIACYDDENLRETLNKSDRKKILTYGFSQEADLILKHANQTFSASFRGRSLGEFKLSIFGRHNILNAAAIILFSLEKGFDLGRLKKAFETFGGPQRRLEFIANMNDIFLFDDYAHHPTEIQAAISALRIRFPKRRILIIFQPHTFSRTQILKSELVAALLGADLAVVTDIYASSREDARRFTVRAIDLEKEALKKGRDNLIYKSSGELTPFLTKTIRKADVVCTMGAGDIYRLKNAIIGTMR